MNTLSLKKNNLIGLREFRESIDKCTKAVAKGMNFTVLKKNVPIFKIVPVDEWGDEGDWNTILDLSQEKDGGIEAGKLLNAMRKKAKNVYKK